MVLFKLTTISKTKQKLNHHLTNLTIQLNSHIVTFLHSI